MADKKLVTYECLLSFSFQTKDDDFMNPDFKFGHFSLVADVSKGALINLSGDVKAKHPFIIADVKHLFFNCSHSAKHDIPAKDFLKFICAHKGLKSFGDCVFEYQPVIGSDFFLGAKKQKELLNEEQKKAFLSDISEKFPRRCRCEKA